MLYLPAVCSGSSYWAGNYTWGDTNDQGWLLPVSNESERFFSNLFDYGAANTRGSRPADASAWSGIWTPPAVDAGWRGTTLAAYETDFYHNMMIGTPAFRTEVLGSWGKHPANPKHQTVVLC
eukprot:m.121924 g.121924  ORF g.121924 m.121924 type:complete len:122 (+) comp16544_c0_seq16:2124-2489(+)